MGTDPRGNRTGRTINVWRRVRGFLPQVILVVGSGGSKLMDKQMLKSFWGWVVMLAVAGQVSAQTIVNDGTTTEGLTSLSNSNGNTSAQITISENGGTLLAAQDGETGTIPFRTLWYPALRLNTNEYSVLTDFKAADAASEDRGGVMGWLDLLAAK